MTKPVPEILNDPYGEEISVMSRATRHIELNYMNAISCLMVILIHVLSLGITTVERSSWRAVVIYIPWRLAAYVVPMFLYTGAVKMAQQFEHAVISSKAYFSYILRRFKKVYLPYVAWVGIYYLFFLHIHWVQGGVGEFLSYLLLGNLSAPMYYIIVVMQFYLLMPLWIWVVRHVQSYVAIGASLMITLCMSQFAGVLSHFGIEFLYADRIFPTYLVFWVAGLYVGKHYDRFLPTVREGPTLIISALVVVVSCGLAFREWVTGEILFNLSQVKMFSDLMSIILLQAVAVKLAKSKGFLSKILGQIYAASFSVYLSHSLFLTWITIVLQDIGVTRLTILLPIRFLTCYTIPFLLYYVVHWAFVSMKGLKRRSLS